MGQIYRAQLYFYQALCVALQVALISKHGSLVHALPGIALLFADQEQAERMAELHALTSTMRMAANSRWFADIAGDEIASMAKKRPLEVVEAATKRGRTLDLWQTAEKLLVELEELGWVNGFSSVDC